MLTRVVPFKILIFSFVTSLFLAGCSDTSSFTSNNKRPIADAGSNITLSVGIQYQLNGGRSIDPEAAVLEYYWEILDKPEGSQASLSNAYAESPVIFFDIPGSYVIGLKVNDGVQDGIPDQIVVTVVQDASTIPAFDPAPGTYYTRQEVNIRFDQDDSVIHYTTDGTKPDADSPVYTPGIDSIEITTSLVLKAVAIDAEGESSPVNSGNYRILPAFDLSYTSFEFPDGAGYGKSNVALKNLTGEKRTWELVTDDPNIIVYPSSGTLDAGEQNLIQIQIQTRDLPEGAYNAVASLYERRDDQRILIRQISLGTNILDNEAPAGTPFISVTPLAGAVRFSWDTSIDDVEGVLISSSEAGSSSSFPENGTVYNAGTSVENSSIHYRGNSGSYVDNVDKKSYRKEYTLFVYDDKLNYGSPLSIVADQNLSSGLPSVGIIGISETGGKLDIRWDPPGMAENEEIFLYRSKKALDLLSVDLKKGFSNGEAVLVYKGFDTGFIDSPENPDGKPLYYYSFAVAGDLSSAISTAVYTPKDRMAPEAPQMLTADSVKILSGDSWILENDLAWVTPVDSDFAGVVVLQSETVFPTGYSLKNGKELSIGISQEGITPVYQGPRSRFTDQNLKSQTLYYYAVCAYDFSRNYSLPAFISAQTVDMTPPPPPSGLTQRFNNDGTVLFAWDSPQEKDFQGSLLLQSSFSLDGFQLEPGREYSAGDLLYNAEGKKVYVLSTVSGSDYLYAGRDWGVQYFRFFNFDTVYNYSEGVGSVLDIPEPAGIDINVSGSLFLSQGDTITLDYSVLDDEGKICRWFSDPLYFDVLFDGVLVGTLAEPVSEALYAGSGSMTSELYLFPMRLIPYREEFDILEVRVQVSGKNEEGDIVFKGLSDSLSLDIKDLDQLSVSRDGSALNFEWPDPAASAYDNVVLLKSEKGFLEDSDFTVPPGSIAGDILIQDSMIIYFGSDTGWIDMLDHEGTPVFYQLYALEKGIPTLLMEVSASLPPAVKAVTLERGEAGEAYLNWEVVSEMIYDPEKEDWRNNVSGTLIVKSSDSSDFELTDGVLPEEGERLSDHAWAAAVIEGFDVGNTWGFWTDRSPDIFGDSSYQLVNYDPLYNYSERVEISSALLQDVNHLSLSVTEDNETEISWAKPEGHEDFRVLLVRWPNGREGNEKPLQGQYYTIGESLGEGTIMYNGPGSRYLEARDSDSLYVYRAFYIDSENRYGPGSFYLYN